MFFSVVRRELCYRQIKKRGKELAAVPSRLISVWHADLIRTARAPPTVHPRERWWKARSVGISGVSRNPVIFLMKSLRPQHTTHCFPSLSPVLRLCCGYAFFARTLRRNLERRMIESIVRTSAIGLNIRMSSIRSFIKHSNE